MATRDKASTRENTVHIGGYFPPEVRTQLKQIALDEGKTAQVLLGEALNLMFAAYNKPPIVPKD